MVDLPPLPPRVARLPKDARGFPVPWFVAWLKGEPDFRVVEPGRLGSAYNKGLCWICGEPMGVHRVGVIGPMCVVNRVTSEPLSHRDCAEFAAQACPFLTKPRMRRNEKDLPEHGFSRGMHIPRNPGAVALYETTTITPFKAGPESWNVLFRLGPPVRVDWYAEGRPATREQVLASIDSGFPILMETAAAHDGPRGVAELLRLRDEAMNLLPAAA